MTREHAQIRVDMWGDDDFRALTPAAQHLYMTLLTDPTLTYAGSADWRPARMAAKASGWTAADVNAAAAELARELFVVVDESTEEILVRSFVKHDGLMKNPRMAVAMLNAYAGIASQALRGVVIFELAKLRRNQPTLKSWGHDISRERLHGALTRDSTDPSTYPTGFPHASLAGSAIGFSSPSTNPTVYLAPTPSVNPSIYPKPTPSVKGFTTPAPTPAPATTSYEVVKNNPSPAAPSSAIIDVTDAEGFGYEADLIDLAAAEPEPAAEASSPKPVVEPKGFVEFWQTYPLKRDKGAGRKAYAKALKLATPEAILEGALRYASDPNRDPGFTKYASTWLNAEAWGDEDGVPARSTAVAAARPTMNDRNHAYLANALGDLRGDVAEPLPTFVNPFATQTQIGA